QYSIPVLMFLYPLAINLIILGLLNPVIKKQKDIYRWSTGLIFIASVFDFFKALPDPIRSNGVVMKIVDFAHLYIPGFDYGFGWVLPGFIGFILGIILWNTKVNRA